MKLGSENNDEKKQEERFENNKGGSFQDPMFEYEKPEEPKQAPPEKIEQAPSEKTEHQDEEDQIEEFWASYRVQKKDIGRTPLEILEMEEKEINEPNEKDEEILDAILVDSVYTKSFQVSNRFSFELTTITSRGSKNYLRLLQQKAAQEEQLGKLEFEALKSQMVVARHLAFFNGKKTCDYEPSEDGFHETDQIEKRLNFCDKFPVQLSDAIGNRVNAFSNRVEMALNRNVENFS